MRVDSSPDNASMSDDDSAKAKAKQSVREREIKAEGPGTRKSPLAVENQGVPSDLSNVNQVRVKPDTKSRAQI